ncbi:MAG: PLDc N-terminal domain-containing protein [Defluviitaleaceae bacterium]|nr:PLDc N-terminal domain-containing protein [Defluviitaleaceae bacterium]
MSSGIVGIFTFIIWLVILGVSLGLPIAATVNMVKKNVSSNDKILWALIIWLGSCIGSIIYFAIGAKQLDEKAAQNDWINKQ